MELTAFSFGVYKLVKYALYPLTWVLLLLGSAALLALLPVSPRRTRWLRLLAVLSFCLLIIVASPIFTDLLFGLLESWHAPAAPPQPGSYDAIVVLAGGVLPAGSIRPTDELTDFSRHRTACGADLYIQGMAPRLLLSGGDALIGRRGPKEADVMKRWAMRLGVPEPAILLEDRSRTTYENAVETRRILGPASIILVSSASHMPRAVALFAKQGFRVVPFPCGFYTRSPLSEEWENLTAFDFIPNAHALERLTQGVAEVAGLAVYWVIGKI